MCNKIEAIKIRDEAYELLKGIFNESLKECYLYGSYAREDYNEYSDVDLFAVIDFKEEELMKYRNEIYSINNFLSLKYDITVSLKIKSKEIFNKYLDILPFYKNVIKDGIRYGI